MSLTVQRYLTLEPDWAEGLKYSRIWKTFIQKSLTGKEVHSAIYTWPRKTLEYAIFATNYAEQAYLKKVLFASINEVWGIPMWQDETILLSDAPAGSSSLTADTTFRNFEKGGQCIIYEDYRTYEVAEISDISDTTITLSSNLENSWPAETRIYPILKARIKQRQQIKSYTRNTGFSRITFQEAFDPEIIHLIGNADSFEQYNGLYVFDPEPAIDGLRQELSKPLQFLSYYGAEETFSMYDETAFTFHSTINFTSREGIWKYIGFFDVHKGRFDAFYAPSNVLDIKIIAPFSANDQILYIEPIDFIDFWFGSDTAKHIIVFWPNGSFICAEITSANDDALILASPIGKAAQANILPQLMCCFLAPCYFGQDELMFNHISPNCGDITISFMEAKE